jgi:bacillopeptidase F
MLIFLRHFPLHFCALLLLVLGCPVPGWADISPELRRILDHSPPDTELSLILTLEPSREIEQLRDNVGRRQRSLRLQTLQQETREAHQQLADFLDQQGVEVKQELWLIHSLAISARAGVIPRLAEHPKIAAIDLNRTYLRTELEPLAFPRPGWNLEPIGARDLWDLGLRGRGTVVAALDSGVDLKHPDLQDGWRGTTANPASGWFDPFNLSRLPTDRPSLAENLGHGTAVTGLIVAGVQSGHALGVAPEAEWIAARIFDENGLSNNATIVASLQWTLDPDGDGNFDDAADIVNASWGLTATGQCLSPSVFHTAIQQLNNSGIAVVAAAGNGGPKEQTSQSPANYPEVLAVGATDATDLITEFSSRGPSPCDESTYPDLIAPGIGLTTTNITNTFASDYVTVAGTSFSTPQVAGVLALLMEAFPDVGIARLEAALRTAASDLGIPGPDNTYGYGRLNALAAYDYLTGVASLGILDSVAPGNDRLLDFSAIPPGQTSQQQVVLRNAGGGELQIDALRFSGQTAPFRISENCSGTTLSSGESCRLDITFAPDILADYQASLEILSTDPDQPEQIVTLLGTGNTPPPAPQLDTPDDGTRVTGPEVTVSWLQDADADGDRIEHEINWVPTNSTITPMSRSAQPADPAVLLYAGAGGLLFLAVPAIRCRQRHVRLIMIALLLTAALLLGSCGGGSDDADSNSLTQTLTGLESGITYEWWVVAVDSRGGRTSSSIRSFKVE